MIRPPFVARVAAGIAVTAVEETMRLPTTAMTLPMTAVSQFLQTTMRVQQTMTSLAIKGDQAFALVHWSHDDEEQPDWAVFDDESEPSADGSAERAAAGPGRFALYSLSPQDDVNSAPQNSAPQHSASQKRAEAPSGSGSSKAGSSKAAAKNGRAVRKVPAEPEIAVYLDYGSLTLAQLRARLRNLSIEELGTLLDYENATLGRAPFQTMLTNRITTAKAK